MPPRPTPISRPKHTANRLSAVYIGSNPATQSQLASSSPSYFTSPPNVDNSHIPDLPEPPSPGASSNGSGLPSPPATNSTGSGSTDDPQTLLTRERPLSFNSSSGSSTGGSFSLGPSMLKGSNGRTLHRSNSSISSVSTSSRPTEWQSRIEEEHHGERNDVRADDHYEYSQNTIDDEEGDDTARLNLRHPRPSDSNENTLALQRVKSLTLRNRMALDKLSSYPRTSTPSRSPVPSHTSSSASGSSTTKSTTSSRLSHPPRHPLSSHSHSQSQPSTSTHQPPDPLSRSGSETERESFYSGSNNSHTNHSNHSNQHLRSLSHHQPRSGGARTPPTDRSIRTRVPSAPDTPLKGRPASDRNSSNDVTTSSNGSSPSRRRKRVSMLLQDEHEGSGRARSSLSFVERDSEVGSSSTRRRSTPLEQLSAGRNRTRAALPVEFRGEGGMISAEPEPMTPYRAPSIAFTSSNSSSASASASASASGSGTSSTRPVHSSTVRGQTKWASDDLTSRSSSSFATSGASASSSRQRAGDEHKRSSTTMMGMGEYRERRQSLRGGSAESALANGYGHTLPRTLVGEGLRAAGLSPTKNRIQRMSLGGAIERDGDVFRRAQDGGWASDDEGEDVGGVRRTRAGTLIGNRSGAARAATSMADYRFLGRERDDERGPDDGDDLERRRALRASKSTYPLRREDGREPSLTRTRELSLTRERERERDRYIDRGDEREREVEIEHERDRDRSASSMSMSRYGTMTRAHLMQQDALPPERYASPFENRRHPSVPPPSSASGGTQQQQQREHTRLMVESLAMFEGHLARLGIGGSGELVRNAQGIVGSAERLNSMLRAATQRAVEQQISAEVDDPGGRGREFSDFWAMVGGEYRDSLRVSDELVRGLTGFLLGVGKTVRDVAASGGADFGQHGRSVSLDEEGLGLVGGRKKGSMSPDVVLGSGGGGRPGSTGGGSGSGRRSVESRRSWEPSREGLRDDLSRRLSARADSALGSARPSSAFNTLREHDRERPLDGRYDTPPPASAQSRGTGTTRRLFAPRDLRDSVATPAPSGMPTIHSQETLYADYEPSPTPAPRNYNQTTLDRSRTLPPLAIPKPLPALPSESLRRNHTVSSKPGASSSKPNQDREHDRRKASMASISTVRANNSNFPASLTTPSNATTAITPHTVSTAHTPDRTAFPSLHRTDSDRSTRSIVTFSRPSTVSVSALNGLQQQHLENQRKRTESGTSSGAEPSTSVPPNRTPQVLSGSETERDTRRKTLGARAGRASLDGPGGNAVGGSKMSAAHPADRSAAVSAGGGGSLLPPMNTAKRERRRTVTDIWPKER
ncbi:hypothetical protein Hypma_016443 [Hypsizygus marmoreus]|uniref:Uncharacterized protein n=1 Tax=Hypsizygus marmoreus TaxID=39966 RepID=A0A369J4Z7_HYPMA|nr:hypothetical protein Hypma_016443 [Hypsizygus marmoreus]